MATPRANEEVLKVILTKLHRLETAFNQINNRLITIETSVVPATGSIAGTSPFDSLHLASCCCAFCINSEPLQQNRQENYKQHPAAEAYKCSVDKLHNQFRFGSSSEVASVTHEEGTVYAHNNEDQSRADDYSVSDRRSRPTSHHDICQDDMKPVLGALKTAPLRYENKDSRAEQMESPGLTRMSSIGSLTKVGSFLGSRKSQSTAAAPAGHPSPCWRGHNTRDDGFKNARGSIRRARSMRCRKTNPSTAQRNAPLMGSANDTLDVDPTLIRRLEEKQILRLYKISQDSARACIALGQRMMHVIHRGG
ncbi:hypothetical protein CGRA01v4_13765 [Colletotrichum graminicola]|nr:hypothetical protein CGRA01v4_13765 [Colletotrichum graminicola]